jgi:2-oxoglutarate dehydrogenase E2 component (dihydrolipoamide succinyltransferase)
VAPKAEAKKEPALAEAGAGRGKAADLISPAVRYQAAEMGIDPTTIPGSGKDGRVLKGDLLAASAKAAAAPAQGLGDSPSANQKLPFAGERTTRRKMSPLRQKIAARLLSAQQETAHLTTFNEIDLSNVMALRAKYQDRFVKKNEIKLGFMSFFVKAVIHALKTVPGVNARLDGDEIVQNNFFDIGVAISTDKGLLVPVLRDADQLSFAGIEKAIAGYAKKARDGKIQLSDLEGGVFTITNGGTFGSLLSTPILNPPQCGILGMHTIQERPVAISGRVEIRPMMYVALTYDHRLVDGKEAVTFLVTVKEIVENPAAVLLEV